MLGDSSAAAKDSTDGAAADVDYRLAALALLVPWPQQGSRALLAEIDSQALTDALSYLGANVTHITLDGAAVGSEDTYPSFQSPEFETMIVDAGKWTVAGISEADQDRILVELTERIASGGALLVVAPNPISRVWSEARAHKSRARASLVVGRWMLRRRHPISMLLRPWGNDALAGAGLTPDVVFVPSPSIGDLRTIRTRRAPVPTALRQSRRRAGWLSRFLLRYVDELTASEHIVLWSAGASDGQTRIPMCHELGGDRTTIIPMRAGPRVGIDSEETFVKFPLDRMEADWMHVEVEDTNRASADVWLGYATPWARLETIGGVHFARFPHIESVVNSRAEAEEALANVYRQVTARADAVRPLAETDVVRRSGSASSAAPESTELWRALRAVNDAARRPVSVMLSHGDLHEGNILISERESRIIDWESTQTNPVFLDPLFSANYFRHHGSGWFEPLIAWVRDEDIGPLGRIAEEHLDGVSKTIAALVTILHAFNNYENEGAVPKAIVSDADHAIRMILAI